MELKTSIAGSKRIIRVAEQLEIILVRNKNIKIVLKVIQFGREAKTELGSESNHQLEKQNDKYKSKERLTTVVY